jgi:class 3 adenylate cyclase/tetratricopeptide (TPR) repeat protein
LAKRILESKSAREGERKQVTVLFADLKASMELLAERDPEDARKLLDPVLDHMMEAVHHYEGTVNQVAGDGIMAIFGAPVTHEDHAVRACYAALRMQEQVKRYAADVFRAEGLNIQIRVGLNSGEVVVGTVGSDLRMDYTAVGRTTHLAARMEQLASPGSILLTPSTFKLVENIVAARPLGAVPVKGLASALEVYELQGMRIPQTGFHVSTRRGLTPLVGRDAELELLERAFERAAKGDARIVGIIGEAGVGKSRLCSEFVSRCRARGSIVYEGRALSHDQTTPYALASAVWRNVFNISAQERPDRAREKVVATLKIVAPDLVSDLPLLFDFVGFSEPGADTLRLDPTTRRERLIRAIVRLSNAFSVRGGARTVLGISAQDPPDRAREKALATVKTVAPDLEPELPLLFDFLGISEAGTGSLKLDPRARPERLGLTTALLRQMFGKHPAILLLEDLQWVDAGSASLIEAYFETLPGKRRLMIVNARPEYAASWMKWDLYEQISLSPLSQMDADVLALRLLGSDASVAPVVPLIADRARGNALFIEELVRQLEESGNLAGERGAYLLQRTPDMRMIPDTVQAIIGARIDSRPELEKSTLQGAAVIGREFTDELLACLTGKSSAELRPVLRDLSSAGLIYEDSDSQGVWAFKHPMMQEVAYRSMLSERRRALHRTVAAEQQKCYPEPNGAQASLIAYHWEAAGDIMQAIGSNMKAAAWYGTGDVARAVFTSDWDRVRDPGRALDAWKRVHRLLAGLSLEEAAPQQLLIACGQIINFGWREGLTAADLKPYYVEALDIARSLGRMRSIALLNAAYGRALAGSGSANDYLALANETLGMFASPEQASLAVQLVVVRCHAHTLVGDLHAALADNDYALANLHQIEERDGQALALSYNPPVWTKYMRGRIFALMGRYDEARSILDELIAGDEAMITPGHRLRAHLAMTNIAFGLGDQALAEAHASAARRLARSNRTSFFKGVSRICTGLELTLRGDHGKAVAMFGDVLRNMRNPGLEGEAAIRCHLAHAQLRAGSLGASRATAEEAAEQAQHYGNKIWLAFAKWLLEGPNSPTFRKLIKETGAEHFMRLRHPWYERPN